MIPPLNAKELRNLFPNITEDCLRRTLAVGAVLPAKREPDPVPALDQNPPGKPGRKKRVGVCVTFVSFRKRLLDEDNHIASLKHFRDIISNSLGVDDADPRIRWQYGQCETRGETGTIVKIERLLRV